ncbi:uncharacterized protein [Spinacia oleracea]|uniref:Retrotransposon gag domain-containing protein n=1 Tax=Spinacia oleracea TaxID=3562 RepID=A0A9R0J6T1_SPIOL|nr:uncharacterized protein LOC110800716 [Spinacia oleracea]
MSSNLHPALAVNNIRNFIPIISDLENSQYLSWAELFKIHATAYEVMDHIITPPVYESSTPPATVEKALWARLHAIVLQWVYGTISNDLLHTILEPGSTAKQEWERLENIFQDNKSSHVVALESQFSHVELSNFPNVTSYCQRLKMLADQLKNVDAPVTDQRLVLQMVAGLTEDYAHMGAIIKHSKPLPDFTEARSMLVLEEDGKEPRPPNTTALNASSNGGDDDDRPPSNISISHGHSSHGPRNNHNKGKGRGGRGKHHGNGGGGKGRGGGGGSGRGNDGGGKGTGGGSWPSHPSWHQPMYGSWGPPQWTPPPCPYPTNNWARPPVPSSRGPNHNSGGILGPHPQQQQVYAAWPNS